MNGSNDMCRVESIDHYDRDPLADADRDFTSVGISWFGHPATYWHNINGENYAGPNCPQGDGFNTTGDD